MKENMGNPFIKILFVFSLLIINTISNAQTIEGIILDEKTNEPILYANIGLIKKNIGTVSNHRGEFKLPISKSNFLDTVGFSSIGYNSVKIKVEDFLLPENIVIKKIYLTPMAYQIAEIIVKPKEFKYLKIGNGSGSKRKKAGFGPNDKLGREMGTIISTKGKEAYLEKATINIGVNNYGKIKLRLNVYNLNNKLPNERINREPIYFETDIKEGECIINLEKYNIKVKDDFLISIEYIEDLGQYGLYFTFSFDKNPTFYRETSLSDWVEMTYENKKVSVSINAILAYEKN